MSKNIIFYGPEGSGKSTQAKMLAEKLDVPCLISGDLVRWGAEFDKGLIGDVCREALSTGHYVADSEMFVLWKGRLKQPDTQNGWVIDGFPRNMTQAEFLADKLDKYGKKIDLVFYLKVDEAVSIERLLKRARKNPDGSTADTEDKIKSRLALYKSQEKDVLEHYTETGVLVEVNGEQDIDAIHNEIVAKAL